MANIIDKTIGYFSPEAGFRRAQNRARMELMEKQLQRNYEGAKGGRRHGGWSSAGNKSVNDVIIKDLKNLVARSRELSINNPYARRAAYVIANSTVGTGILPRHTIAETVEGGKIKTYANGAEIIKIVSAAWKEWAENLGCDYNGDYNIYGLQHLIMRTVIVSGEMLAVRKYVKTDVNKYGLQIQLLEGDYIDTSKNTQKDPDGGYTFNGIKYDSNFKRSGYWLYDRHPSETGAKSSFVPIKDVLHVFDVERTGQNRGVPAAASTILKQRDLDDYEDAELLGKKVSACMPIFVENADPDATKDPNAVIEMVEPGAINYLQPNEKVSFATPPTNNGFSEFTKTQHRGIAAGYLLTYEQLTGDLSNVNFSSGRMGWLEFQRQVYNWQYLMLIPKFCEGVYSWFLQSLAITQGDKFKGVPIKAEWTAPRREMIDPVKETTAIKEQIRGGLISLSEAIRQNGYNPEDIINELSEDQKTILKAGLVLDSNPYFEIAPKKPANDEQEENTNSATKAK